MMVCSRTKPADYNNSLWGIIPFCLVMSFLFLLLVIGIYREWDKDFLKTRTYSNRICVFVILFVTSTDCVRQHAAVHTRFRPLRYRC